MACGYHINQEDGLITVTGNAELELSELATLGRDLLTDQEFCPEYAQLIDLRGIFPKQPDIAHRDTLRNFVVQEFRPSVKASIAVVIDDSLERLELADLYHLIVNLNDTELFDSYEQALKWLVRREFATPAAAQLR
ncbi:MAG: hypothetical protein AAF529_03695 [Pseudomonadota bacterium]